MGVLEVNRSEPQAPARGLRSAFYNVIARLTKDNRCAGWHAHARVGMVACWALLAVGLSQATSAAPSLELIAEATLATETPLDPRPVGGLSGLAHIEGDRWMAVSDDARSPRAYEIEIALDDVGALHASVVAAHDLVTNARDAESIARAPDGGWFIGFESPATIFHCDAHFRNPRELAAARDAGAALQRNKGWESLTVLPGETPALLAISELGPAPTAEDPQRFRRARAILLDTATGESIAKGEYPISPPPGFGPTGLVEIAAIDATRFLALQRSLTVGRGYDGVVELVAVQIADGELTFTKTRLGSLRDVGVRHVGNAEAMAMGRELDDGGRLLIVISDNNFERDGQPHTQVLALRSTP